VAATCGSGVSACVLAFALHLLGHRQFAVYDGSWTEWGGRSDTPVEIG
jgi:thiosulfate/3-mercaptopyruvate sulfurtransferase